MLVDRATKSSSPTRSTAAPCRRSTTPTTACKIYVQPLIDKQRVPMMGGFIGATREGVTTTIGRGGSDFSAALVGRGTERRSHRDLDRRRRHEDNRSAHLSRRAPHQGHQLRRSRRTRLFRRQSLAPRNRAARGREEHSGAGAELAQSVESRHAHPGAHAAFEVAVQGHRGEEHASRSSTSSPPAC